MPSSTESQAVAARARVPADPTSPSVQQPPARQWFRTAVPALVIVGAVAFTVTRWWPAWQGVPVTEIRASGRIEGRTVTIAPKDIQARVARLFVDEGDRIAAGQLVAQLTAAQLDARQRSLDANVLGIEAQLQQAALDVAHTQKSVAATIDAATAAVQGAEATAVRARAVRDHATAAHARALQLLADRVISRSEFDQFDAARRTADADVVAADRAVDHARSSLALAQASTDTIALKRQQLRVLEAGRVAAQAQRAEAEALIAEREIVAPAAGTILTRTVEVGDVVAPGSPLFTVVDLQRLYVKIYVPEPDVPRLTLGAEADVSVDAFPRRPFRARISRIADQAEFTPKNVETADERVKLVFGVELTVENPDGLLKPGMPADCTIHPAVPSPQGAVRRDR